MPSAPVRLTRLCLPVAVLATVLLAPVHAQVEASPALEAGEGRAVARELAADLAADYTFPDTGLRYATGLRAKADAGAYDNLADRAALARALTADVQAIAPDGHIRVTVKSASPRAGGRPVLTAVDEARWLAPGVAYIRYNIFDGSPASIAATEAFMRDHADAKTVIFDLRTHHGGGLDEMEHIFPYLYAKPTPLVVLQSRSAVEARQGAIFEDGPTVHRIAAPEGLVRREHVAVPDAAEHRLVDAKVYVLTSPATASAAEHFALALKRTHRATLIGSATAGANHFGGFAAVGAHFSAFIPSGRTYDPDTGRDWEGAGVIPDISVAPEAALTKALELSGVVASDAERLSAEVRPAAPMTRPKRA